MTVKRYGKSVDELVGDMTHKILKGMDKGVKRVEADAKMLVGVDTGALRRSLTSNATIQGDEVVGQVGSNLDYAFFHSLQNPYLESALDMNLEYIKAEIAKGAGE